MFSKDVCIFFPDVCQFFSNVYDFSHFIAKDKIFSSTIWKIGMCCKKGAQMQ